MSHRMRSLARHTLCGVVLAAALVLMPLAQASYAADGDLVVTPMPADPMFTNWQPGTARHWLVDADLRGARSGTFAMRVTGSGGMVDASAQGLQLEVRTCSSAYGATTGTVRPDCGGTERTILANSNLSSVSSAPGAVAGTRTWKLPRIVRGDERHFLLTLTRPAATSIDTTIVQARFGVGFTATGDGAGDASDDSSHTGSGLPGTGGPAFAWLGLGLALLLAGSVVMRRARR